MHKQSDVYHPVFKDVYMIHNASIENPILSVDDGFNFGLSFFETFYISKYIVFLDEHLTRINSSLIQFNIPIHIDRQLILDLVSYYDLKDIALKLQVSEKNIIASTRPITYTPPYYEKGASLMTSPIIRSSHSELVRHKSGNYGDSILALRKAHDLGFDDYLFYNELGHITETSIANIFILKDNQLYTPSLSDGLLPGVVRYYILKKFPVIQSSLTKEFLLNCDGAFMTNSLVGLVKIHSIDSHVLPNNSRVELIRQTYLHDIKEPYVS